MVTNSHLVATQMRDILVKPQTIMDEPAYKPRFVSFLHHSLLFSLKKLNKSSLLACYLFISMFSLNQDARRRELLRIMRKLTSKLIITGDSIDPVSVTCSFHSHFIQQGRMKQFWVEFSHLKALTMLKNSRLYYL